MAKRSVHLWVFVHKWTSLICTVFLLMLCVTGMPLIFANEINDMIDGTPAAAPHPSGTSRLSLDTLVSRARSHYPGEVPLFVGWRDGGDRVYVNLGPTPGTPAPQMHTVLLDARTGDRVPARQFNQGFMYVVERLHVDMLAGLWGKLFLGAMGMLFAIAIVSGVVLYRPFMAKLDFATVRRERSPRLKWLDLHNLIGIVTTGWLMVVALTGVINTLETPLYAAWQRDEVARVARAWQGKPIPTKLGSLDKAVRAARAARPAMTPAFISYPGNGYSGDHHYGVFMFGNTPLTKRNFQPVLLDAETSELTAIPQWPIALSAMYVTQPLHFGNYAGLTLKILWFVFDLLAIVVLMTGLYLWLRRRGAPGDPKSTEGDDRFAGVRR